MNPELLREELGALLVAHVPQLRGESLFSGPKWRAPWQDELRSKVDWDPAPLFRTGTQQPAILRPQGSPGTDFSTGREEFGGMVFLLVVEALGGDEGAIELVAAKWPERSRRGVPQSQWRRGVTRGDGEEVPEVDEAPPKGAPVRSDSSGGGARPRPPRSKSVGGLPGLPGLPESPGPKGRQGELERPQDRQVTPRRSLAKGRAARLVAEIQVAQREGPERLTRLTQSIVAALEELSPPPEPLSRLPKQTAGGLRRDDSSRRGSSGPRTVAPTRPGEGESSGQRQLARPRSGSTPTTLLRGRTPTPTIVPSLSALRSDLHQGGTTLLRAPTDRGRTITLPQTQGLLSQPPQDEAPTREGSLTRERSEGETWVGASRERSGTRREARERAPSRRDTPPRSSTSRSPRGKPTSHPRSRSVPVVLMRRSERLRPVDEGTSEGTGLESRAPSRVPIGTLAPRHPSRRSPSDRSAPVEVGPDTRSVPRRERKERREDGKTQLAPERGSEDARPSERPVGKSTEGRTQGSTEGARTGKETDRSTRERSEQSTAGKRTEEGATGKRTEEGATSKRTAQRNTSEGTARERTEQRIPGERTTGERTTGERTTGERTTGERTEQRIPGESTSLSRPQPRERGGAPTNQRRDDRGRKQLGPRRGDRRTGDGVQVGALRSTSQQEARGRSDELLRSGRDATARPRGRQALRAFFHRSAKGPLARASALSQGADVLSKSLLHWMGSSLGLSGTRRGKEATFGSGGAEALLTRSTSEGSGDGETERSPPARQRQGAETVSKERRSGLGPRDTEPDLAPTESVGSKPGPRAERGREPTVALDPRAARKRAAKGFLELGRAHGSRLPPRTLASAFRLGGKETAARLGEQFTRQKAEALTRLGAGRHLRLVGPSPWSKGGETRERPKGTGRAPLRSTKQVALTRSTNSSAGELAPRALQEPARDLLGQGRAHRSRLPPRTLASALRLGGKETGSRLREELGRRQRVAWTGLADLARLRILGASPFAGGPNSPPSLGPRGTVLPQTEGGDALDSSHGSGPPEGERAQTATRRRTRRGAVIRHEDRSTMGFIRAMRTESHAAGRGRFGAVRRKWAALTRRKSASPLFAKSPNQPQELVVHPRLPEQRGGHKSVGGIPSEPLVLATEGPQLRPTHPGQGPQEGKAYKVTPPSEDKPGGSIREQIASIRRGRAERGEDVSAPIHFELTAGGFTPIASKGAGVTRAPEPKNATRERARSLPPLVPPQSERDAPPPRVDEPVEERGKGSKTLPKEWTAPKERLPQRVEGSTTSTPLEGIGGDKTTAEPSEEDGGDMGTQQMLELLRSLARGDAEARSALMDIRRELDRMDRTRAARQYR